MRPKLGSVPRGEWRCESCERDRRDELPSDSEKPERPKRAAARRVTVIDASSGDDDDDVSDSGDDYVSGSGRDTETKTRGHKDDAYASEIDGTDGAVSADDADAEPDAIRLGWAGRGTKRALCVRTRTTTTSTRVTTHAPNGQKFYDLNSDSVKNRVPPGRSVRPRRAAATRKKNLNDSDSDFAEDEDENDDDAALEDAELLDATICATCRLGDDPSNLVLCDGCDGGYHMYCLRPKLVSIPRGEWHCPSCHAKREAAAAETLERQRKADACAVAAAGFVRGKKVHVIMASRKVELGVGVGVGGINDGVGGINDGVGGTRDGVGGMGKQSSDDVDDFEVFAPSKHESSIEFLCKFENESYRHAIWVPLWVLSTREKGKLRGHWKRFGGCEDDPECAIGTYFPTQIQRLFAHTRLTLSFIYRKIRRLASTCTRSEWWTRIGTQTRCQSSGAACCTTTAPGKERTAF